MRKKTVLTVLLTALIFISACVLTVTTVYRVSAVTLEIQAISEEAKTEAETLEKSIAAHYKGKNIFSADSAVARLKFEEYPHFRMTSFKKAYPNRLIVTASEDAEVYAVESENGYRILGASGVVLCDRETPKNRSDGHDNVIIKGVLAAGQRGSVPTDEYFLLTIAFCEAFDTQSDGIRNNVVSVTLEKPTSNDDYAYLRLKFREGAEAIVYSPLSKTQEKAKSLYSYYASVSTEKRMSGVIYVSEEGKCHYEP